MPSETLADDVAVLTRDGGAASVIDRIRAKHEHTVRHHDIHPPRWGGDVVIRCGRRVPKKMLEQLSGSSTKQAARLIVLSCQQILVRDADGELLPIDDDPVRFDARLAAAFRLPGDSADKMCLALYADDVPLIAQAQEVYDFLTGKDLGDIALEETEAELGEVIAAP